MLFTAPALGDSPETLARARSFYGSYQVTTQDGRHILAHGTTIHGSQYVSQARKEDAHDVLLDDGAAR